MGAEIKIYDEARNMANIAMNLENDIRNNLSFKKDIDKYKALIESLANLTKNNIFLETRVIYCFNFQTELKKLKNDPNGDVYNMLQEFNKIVLSFLKNTKT